MDNKKILILAGLAGLGYYFFAGKNNIVVPETTTEMPTMVDVPNVPDEWVPATVQTHAGYPLQGNTYHKDIKLLQAALGLFQSGYFDANTLHALSVALNGDQADNDYTADDMPDLFPDYDTLIARVKDINDNNGNRSIKKITTLS